MKTHAGILAAFTVATGFSLPTLAQEATPAPQLPHACAFLQDTQLPVNPAAKNFPSSQKFRDCFNAIFDPYKALEVEIQSARQQRNTEVLTQYELLEKQLQLAVGKVRQEEIAKYESRNGHSIEQDQAALDAIEDIILQETLPYQIILNLSRPDEQAKMGGCLAPYNSFLSLEGLILDPDIALHDWILLFAANALAECSSEIGPRIRNDRANKEQTAPLEQEEGQSMITIDEELLSGLSKGFVEYLKDPEGLIGRAERQTPVLEMVAKKLEYRWCSWFMSDQDNPRHYKYIKDRPELIPEHKTVKIEQCMPVLAAPNS